MDKFSCYFRTWRVNCVVLFRLVPWKDALFARSQWFDRDRQVVDRNVLGMVVLSGVLLVFLLLDQLLCTNFIPRIPFQLNGRIEIGCIWSHHFSWDPKIWSALSWEASAHLLFHGHIKIPFINKFRKNFSAFLVQLVIDNYWIWNAGGSLISVLRSEHLASWIIRKRFTISLSWSATHSWSHISFVITEQHKIVIRCLGSSFLNIAISLEILGNWSHFICIFNFLIHSLVGFGIWLISVRFEILE